MFQLKQIKPAILASLIVIGFAFHSKPAEAAGTEVLTVAGGCFWCVESDFERVPGVKEVVSGYTGGKKKNPTYKDVTKGGSGHYEAVQIQFDPAKLFLDQLLNMFFRSVNPMDAGGQLCDRSNSYCTVVFGSNNAQNASAKAAKQVAQNVLGQKIVTPISQDG